MMVYSQKPLPPNISVGSVLSRMDEFYSEFDLVQTWISFAIWTFAIIEEIVASLQSRFTDTFVKSKSVPSS